MPTSLYILFLIIPIFFIPLSPSCVSFFFFFNDTATTEIYTLSLHDALPICSLPRSNSTIIANGPCNWDFSNAFRVRWCDRAIAPSRRWRATMRDSTTPGSRSRRRSEEHTSELQSHLNLVCRLLLEKKKNTLMLEANIGFSNRGSRESEECSNFDFHVEKTVPSPINMTPLCTKLIRSLTVMLVVDI